MKKIITILLVSLFAVACGSTPKKSPDYSKIDKSYNSFKGNMQHVE